MKQRQISTNWSSWQKFLDYLVLGKEPEKEIVVEQRGKMNVWEYLNEESKRPLTRGDIISLIFVAVVVLGSFFIMHYF